MPLANFQLIFAFFGWKRPSQNFNHFFRFIKFAPSFILDQMIAFMIKIHNDWKTSYQRRRTTI